MIETVALYVRKSRADIEQEKKSAERGEEYDTLKRHRNELLRLAKRKSYQIIEIYEEVVSGDTIEARPEMQRLLKDVKDYLFDAILVIDYDRLGRGDKEDQGRIEKILKDTDTLIITPSEIIDLNSEQGEFTADTKSFIARMEYRISKKRFKEGKKRSTSEGKDVSNKQPFGYSKDPITKKLVPDENAQYVVLAFELYDELETLNGVMEEFERIGIPTKNNRKWAPVTIRRMLRNKKYIGTMFFNQNSKRDYIEQEDAHDPIIDKELFARVNAKLDNIKSHRTGKKFELKNAFASLGKCMKCNAVTKYHNTYVPYIRCSNTKCEHRFIGYYEYEKAVLNELKNILDNISVDLSELEIPTDKTNAIQSQIKKITDEENELKVRENNLYVLLENNTYTPAVFKERLDMLNIEKNEIKQKLEELQVALDYELTQQNRIFNMGPTIKNALEIYHDASIHQRNRILKSIIKEIRSFKSTRSDRYGNNRTDFDLEIILHENNY